MKKFLILTVCLLSFLPVYASTDKMSEDYLKNKTHLSVMNPLAERVVQNIIKKSLKKEIGKGNYKVKFQGYTLASMKNGIFKYLEITGEDIDLDGIPLPYMNVRTLTDYNKVDLKQEPIKIISDVTLAYNLNLSEESVNAALKDNLYKKKLEKVNKIAYPLFTMNDVRMKIKNNKVYIIMDYSLPLVSKKSKTFMVASNFKVDNGKIKATNVSIDNAYGNLSLDKVTNLINLLDPLTFTLDLMNDDSCQGRIENIKIEDNIIKIDGKIFVKGAR